MGKLVCGIGIYEKGKYSTWVENKQSVEYRIWVSMLGRCYNKSAKIRQPTYKDCTVSENFKNFQYFAEWCQSQTGFGLKDYQLDKDIIVKGNKVYSEDVCVFVPREINFLLLDHAAKRGEYPIGVSYNTGNNKFQASLSRYGKVYNLGYFPTSEQAYQCYRDAKESHVKAVAASYRYLVDPRVYKALMKWKVV
jgi:hypothetical protein